MTSDQLKGPTSRGCFRIVGSQCSDPKVCEFKGLILMGSINRETNFLITAWLALRKHLLDPVGLKGFSKSEVKQESLQTENVSNARSQYNKSQGLKAFGQLQKRLKTVKTLGWLLPDIQGPLSAGRSKTPTAAFICHHRLVYKRRQSLVMPS